MAKSEDTLKTRKLYFSKHHHHGQAKDAMALLKDVNSIEKLSLHSPTRIAITYDIRKLSLQMIEAALIKVGFTLDNGLLQRFKRSLCAYCEDAERERLGVNLEGNPHQDPLQLSEKLAQDPRPNDWRHYTK
jgi:hypothetical protein